jgi:hypothetical protein
VPNPKATIATGPIPVPKGAPNTVASSSSYYSLFGNSGAAEGSGIVDVGGSGGIVPPMKPPPGMGDQSGGSTGGGGGNNGNSTLQNLANAVGGNGTAGGQQGVGVQVGETAAVAGGLGALYYLWPLIFAL